jgi:uncharacterized integral membrane protein
MQIATALLILVLALVAGFAALNWSAFTTPATLWLGVATVEVPLGLLLLGAMALVALLFVAGAIVERARTGLQARRHARELSVQRDRADLAEASRVAELHEFVAAELARQAKAADASRDGILARLDRMETQQRLLIEQTGNTLSAYIGQLEQRLEHAPPPVDDAAHRGLHTPRG